MKKGVRVIRLCHNSCHEDKINEIINLGENHFKNPHITIEKAWLTITYFKNV